MIDGDTKETSQTPASHVCHIYASAGLVATDAIQSAETAKTARREYGTRSSTCVVYPDGFTFAMLAAVEFSVFFQYFVVNILFLK